jgi:tetratricopeptide (TPR) repeat protein
LRPIELTALQLLANIDYLSGLRECQDAFIGLLDRHPQDEEAAYMHGRTDYAAGQFERALKINSESYKAYDNLGLCYQARGETELATRYFLRAIKLVENDAFERTFAAASTAADQNPNAARDFYLGGKALCKLQKVGLCIGWLERSVSLDLTVVSAIQSLWAGGPG